MIIQVDKASGAVLSFDFINAIEDIEKFTPSYIDVLKVTRSYLGGLTISQLRKMADLANIPLEEGATKGEIVDTILNFKPEKK